MSEDTLRIVQRRIFDALNALVQLSSTSKELKNRFNYAKERLTAPV